MRTSQSRSSLPFLARATSIKTWGTHSMWSEGNEQCNEEEAQSSPENDGMDVECLKPEAVNGCGKMRTSESKSTLPFLARATSIKTWGTHSMWSEGHQLCNEEEAQSSLENDGMDVECLKPEAVNGCEKMRTSESKSSLPFLVRATSMVTWGTHSLWSESHQQCNEEEAQSFLPLIKKCSLSGKTILPAKYGTTDDDISECSYFTVTDYDDWSDESCISFDKDVDKMGGETDLDTSSPSDDCELQPTTTLKDPAAVVKDTTMLSDSNVSQSCYVRDLKKFCVKVITKSKGARRHQPVVRLRKSECLWTFSGCFLTLYTIGFLSENVPFWNRGDKVFAFPLGPFGALSTLQFGLPGAPPAQPRSVICGSTISGLVAISSTYLPESIFPISFRIAFATSASIALMARFGVIHPPGGAIALVFAIGNYHLGHLLLTLLGCLIAVLIASVFNNLDDARQYPIYWNISAVFERQKEDKVAHT